MLSELSKIGLSAEAIYCLDCDNHKEYLQRKAEVQKKCEGKNGENKPKESQWQIS